LSPEVSIVMSCYNSEATVVEAIESILNQTFSNFEFIIIDDGSIDSTRDILSSYQQKERRIVLIENEQNIGLAAALNKGIRMASTPLIARMDADDVSLPTRLEKQIEFLHTHPNVDILEAIIKRIFKTTMILHPTIMVKKEVFEIHGYYDTQQQLGGEDAELWYRIYDKVRWANLSEPLLIYTVKNKLTKRIISNNLKTKYINMKRRNVLFQKGHLLIRDIFIYGAKLISQTFKN